MVFTVVQGLWQLQYMYGSPTSQQARAVVYTKHLASYTGGGVCVWLLCPTDDGLLLRLGLLLLLLGALQLLAQCLGHLPLCLRQGTSSLPLSGPSKW